MGGCASVDKTNSKLKYLELGQGCIQRAKEATHEAEIESAIEAYEQAIGYLKDALNEDSQLAKNLLNQCYMDIANLYEQQKVFEKAKDYYQEAKKSGEPKADLKLKELITRISQLTLEPKQQVELPNPVANSSSTVKPLPQEPSDIDSSLHNSAVGGLPKKPAKKQQFIKNPIVSKLKEYKDLSDIKNTKELAGFLIQVPNDDLAYQDLQELALAVIEAFAREQVKTQKLINEVIVLAASENEAIIQALLEQFIQPIRDKVLLDGNLLDGLAEVLRHANPALLNADDLSKILDVISEKLTNLHQQGSEKTLLSLIQGISKVLAAMADANVKGLSRVEQHEPLYQSLSALIEGAEFHCRQAALYARQALVRVPDDETKLQSAIRRIIKIGQGLNSLNDAFQQKSPLELLNAFISFKEAFKYQVRQKSWYDALHYAELLIECNHFTGFEEFIKSSEYYTQEGMLYGIIRLLSRTIETHFDLEVRCNALKLLTQLWQEQGQLEHKTIDKLKGTVNEYTMLQDGEFFGRHNGILRWIAEIFLTSYSNQQLRQAAQEQLEELIKTSSPFQQTIFAEIIPRNYRELGMLAEADISYSTHLLDLAQKKWETDLTERVANIGARLRRLSSGWIKDGIDKKLLELKKSILNDKELIEELAIYIPVNGSYQRYANQDTSTFDLATKIQELFTDDNKKVLLLLGSAGVGKSTFNRYLERSLWEKYQKGDAIPLFISLPSLTNPENELLQEYLQILPPSCSFNQQEIGILQHQYKFIFDGYDEINKLSNLYLKNHLENWQAKVIISCRTDYLTGMANNDTKIFMPYVGAKPQYQAFMELSVVPFSDEQITAYITKYLMIHKDNPDKDLPWQEPKEYEEQITKIPGLKQLIKTPFLLMVAMDIMPHIVGRYAELEEKERTNITRVRLLDEFVQQLFEREEDKLMIEDKLPTDGSDVKEDFWAFAMELAVAMHEIATNDVYYAPQGSSLFGGTKDSNPWERFFGTPTDSKKAERLIRARNGCNCVLRTIGKHRRAFIHSTLQDYFVIRKIKIDEEKSLKPMPKVFTPFYSRLAGSGVEQEVPYSDIPPPESSVIALKARV